MTEIHIFDNAANATDIAAGDWLFQQGDPADVMFAVVAGDIELSIDDRVVETAGPGTIIGEMALIDDTIRSGSARAATDARIVPVPKDQFLFMVQSHPTFALQVMSVMADRIRSRDRDRRD